MTVHAGELVESTQKPLGGALAQGDIPPPFPILPPKHQDGTLLHPPFRFGQTNRENGLLPFPIGCAEQLQGAVVAFGVAPRGADQGT